MRQEIIVKSLLQRVNVPTNLLMVGLVGGMFCLFQLVSRIGEIRAADLAMPFILLFGHLALAPAPWQWTGDEADRAGLGRGFVQALGFGLIWISLVLAGLHLAGGAPRLPLAASFPHGPFPGPLPFPPGAMPPPRGPLPFPGAGHPFPGVAFRPGLALGLVNLGFGIAFGWVYAAKEATEAEERRMAHLLRQSQVRALQNQLEPHVLYNALNGLAELVHEDPLAAEEMTARLADLYRMLTVHGEAGRIRLEQERKLVEAYLDMEQMRLGERLQVHWHWPSWADQQVLPPFLLLPLVENAIKHGISPAETGGEVVIACVHRGSLIQLKVANTGRPLEAGGRGVGLGNLEARLELWTELAGTFKLETRDGWTTATVQWIPEG